MIVHNPQGLHESIRRRGSDKRPAAFFQLFAQQLRFGRLRNSTVERRMSVRFELPDERGQRSKLVDQFQRSLRVVDGRFNLTTMPASFSSRSTLELRNLATFSKSKSLNARRKFCRFRRIVSQLKPA